jgi:hypothetical protein
MIMLQKSELSLSEFCYCTVFYYLFRNKNNDNNIKKKNSAALTHSLIAS